MLLNTQQAKVLFALTYNSGITSNFDCTVDDHDPVPAIVIVDEISEITDLRIQFKKINRVDSNGIVKRERVYKLHLKDKPEAEMILDKAIDQLNRDRVPLDFLA
ncbi:MAG: hypothetical protein K6L74_16050 [Neptuniibacter sp.]